VLLLADGCALRRKAGLLQGCGHQHENLGHAPDIEDGVDVRSRAIGIDASLGAVQVHHLAAYEGPSVRDLLGKPEQAQP
jgi:hypothetical protein